MRRTIQQTKAAGREYRAASHRYRWHMRSHGRVPIEVVKRLAQAQAMYVAAIAGRRGGGR